MWLRETLGHGCRTMLTCGCYFPEIASNLMMLLACGSAVSALVHAKREKQMWPSCVRAILSMRETKGERCRIFHI